MPYITIPIHPKGHQLTFDEVLAGVNLADFNKEVKDTHDTRTVYRQFTPPKLLENLDTQGMINVLKAFMERHNDLYTTPIIKFYNTFYLIKRGKGIVEVLKAVLKENGDPFLGSERYTKTCRMLISLLSNVTHNHPTEKNEEILDACIDKCVSYLEAENLPISKDKFKEAFSSGFRRIDAPLDRLKDALTELKTILETKFYASYHSAAFAYVKGRSAVDAVRRHQENGSRWFLKTDAHNFFGSTTLNFVVSMLQQIYPFSEVMIGEYGFQMLKKTLEICFLNGSLPQGTPISPIITNIMMIPIDHAIAKLMRERTPHICYTRYADDMMFSAQLSFEWKDVCSDVVRVLKEFNAPFELHEKKTRYGSANGRNWMLGVMYNKDLQITIGHDNKKALKAALHSLLMDYTHGIKWDAYKAQQLGGDISYYKMIEKDSIEKIIKNYNDKFNLNVYDVLKEAVQ